MATPEHTQAQAPRGPSGRAGETLHAYGAARQQALAAFLAHGRIHSLWRSLTLATDQLLKAVAEAEGLTLVAVGGYGRRELFPFSDVDVLLLLPEGAEAEQVGQRIGAVLQQLWDMHVPVSHAVRSVAQALADAQTDHTIAASLMDARLISGDRALYLRLKRGLQREVYGHEPRAFVEAKLSERDKRHGKWGDSRFMLEPQVKDGKGGLRDLQTLNWLSRYCYRTRRRSDLVRDDVLSEAEWRHYRDAYRFFATVRAYIHILRGRGEERLTFDLQTDIATRMKFPGNTAQARAEHFMARYFDFARQVGNLTRIFCAILEEENLRVPQAPFAADIRGLLLPGFTLAHGRIGFAPGMTPTPVATMQLFLEAERYGLDIDPRAHVALSRARMALAAALPHDKEANAIFLDILLSRRHPDQALRRMNELGMLTAILPEFTGITGQMQYDGYHTYTVDEHTLVAVGNLFALESGLWAKEMPLATSVVRDVADRAALYLGMLCHDIAKGMGGGHATKGEALVLAIAARLGLSPAQGELAAWLVGSHLLFSETAFKRDLEDAQTIADFIAVVQSPERLRLLLLITVADIKAVGPAIWNGWKGSLMRNLYQRAMAAMGVAAQPTENLVWQDMPAYRQWLAEPSSVGIGIAHDTFNAITEITVCLTNRPHLFRLLAGVMAWMGGSIVSARIRVLPDGAAIAVLGIQDMHGESFAAEEKRLKQLPQLIAQALAGTLDFAAELPRRRRVARAERQVPVEPGVFIDNKVSAQATVIEVNARDRLGLLYDILGAMEACQLQVMSAHIATYGQKAVDVFYVKDAYGIKLDHRTKLAQTHRVLMEALTHDAT